MMRLGWSPRSVLNQLALDFPDVPVALLQKIYEIAQVSCTAAAQYKGKPDNWTPNPLSIPELPE